MSIWRKMVRLYNHSVVKYSLISIALVLTLLNTYASFQDTSATKLPSISSSKPNTHKESATEQYLNVLGGNTQISRTDLLRKAIEELKKENEDRLLKQLEKDIRWLNEERIVTELKKSFQKKFTRDFYRHDLVSGALLKEMKDSFLARNQYTMQSFITQNVIFGSKNTGQFTDLFESDAQAQKVADVLVNALNVAVKPLYEHIYNEIIVANDPKVSLNSLPLNNVLGQQHFSTPRSLSRKQLTQGTVEVSDQQFEALQQSHDNVVNTLMGFKIPIGTDFSGDGIVINVDEMGVGGALVTILKIRYSGSVLPIELVLNKKQESTTQICDVILPQYNAKCIYLQEKLPFLALDTTDKASPVNKFELKVWGIFVSSFDNVIALDADSVPIKNVDDLLYTQDFLATGFVLWPDYWEKTTSPVYYDLARFDVGEVVRRFGVANEAKFADYSQQPDSVCFHDLDGIPDRRTVESGQMLVSKSRHLRSLILALYYNRYGPAAYYPLFYQGGAGDGDKDTFVPALHVFQEPYYIVEKDPAEAGWKSGRDLVETTIIQYAPTSAKYHLKAWKKWLREHNFDVRLWPYQKTTYTEDLYRQFLGDLEEKLKNKQELDDGSARLTPFFLHVHKPKINPFVNYKNKMGILNKRNMGSPEDLKPIFGTDDWELNLHAISQAVVCSVVTDKVFYDKYEIDQQEACDKISQYVSYLKKDSGSPEMGDIDLTALKKKEKEKKVKGKKPDKPTEQ